MSRKTIKPGTIAIDFDGVIHSYESGWQNGEIYGKLLPGAVSAIEKLMRKRHPIMVFTARTDLIAVADWLIGQTDWDVAVDQDGQVQFWNAVGTVLVTNRKLPAAVYIDDRAHRFRSWEHTEMALEQLLDPTEMPDIFIDSARALLVGFNYVDNHGGRHLRKHIAVHYQADGLLLTVDTKLSEGMRQSVFGAFIEAFRGNGWGFSVRYTDGNATRGDIKGYNFNHPVTLTRIGHNALENMQS